MPPPPVFLSLFYPPWLDLGYFSHVTRDHPFQDSGLFYRFAEDAKTGGVAADETGQKVSTVPGLVSSQVNEKSRVRGASTRQRSADTQTNYSTLEPC